MILARIFWVSGPRWAVMTGLSGYDPPEWQVMRVKSKEEMPGFVVTMEVTRQLLR